MCDYVRARHHRSPSRSEVRRPGLHPPRPTMRIDNDLLSRASVSDAPGNLVDSSWSTLRHRRDMGELDGWAGAAFLRMASLRCKTKAPNEDERPCQLSRQNACHASRSASSRVVPCEHFRQHGFSAEDIASLFCEQTPIEVLWALDKALAAHV